MARAAAMSAHIYYCFIKHDLRDNLSVSEGMVHRYKILRTVEIMPRRHHLTLLLKEVLSSLMQRHDPLLALLCQIDERLLQNILNSILTKHALVERPLATL